LLQIDPSQAPSQTTRQVPPFIIRVLSSAAAIWWSGALFRKSLTIRPGCTVFQAFQIAAKDRLPWAERSGRH
jgi:hypothetical protein